MGHAIEVKNGITIHNFLRHHEDIETKCQSPGIRGYKIKNGTFFLATGDLVIKWSDSGCNKTVYRILNHTNIGNFTYVGTMKDLCHFKEITPSIKVCVEATDNDFRFQSGWLSQG